MRPGPRLVPLLALGLLAALAAGWLLPGAGGAAAAWALALGAAAAWLALRGQLPRSLEVTLEGPEVLVHNRPARYTLRIEGARAPLRLTLSWDADADVQLELERERLVLPAGGEVSLALTATARRRGPAELGPLRAWAGDPVGLWERRITCRLRQVSVYPAAAAAGGPRARRLGGGAGRPRPVPGAGTEFRSLRPYLPGDDPRAIHWPATARLGVPICRTWSGEEAPRVLLAVDCSRRMSPGDGAHHTRMDRAVEAAIGLARQLSGAPVGAAAFERRVLRACPPTRRGLPAVTRLLADLQPTDFEPDYAELFRDLRDRLRRRALIIVLTAPEGDDDLAGSLKLVSDRHRVMVAAVGDRALRVMAGESPGGPALERLEDLHARASARTLLEERRRHLARLRAAGATVTDADASELERSLRAHYLRLVSAGPV